MPRRAPALRCATGPPVTARPSHARPIRQPSMSSAKEKKKWRRRPTLRAGSVERLPPGDWLLALREGDGPKKKSGNPNTLRTATNCLGMYSPVAVRTAAHGGRVNWVGRWDIWGGSVGGLVGGSMYAQLPLGVVDITRSAFR